MELSRTSEKTGGFRPTPRGRLLVYLFVLATVVLSSGSCLLFEPEESLEPSPIITAPVPTTNIAPPAPTTTAASTTSAAAPTQTAKSESPDTTSTTLSPHQQSMTYLDQLLVAVADIGELVAGVETINDNWDNRSQTGVSFSETRAALESAVERSEQLRDAFELIEPAPADGMAEEHRTATAAVGLIVDTASEMLDGLRSTDTGQARRAAVVGFLTAFDILQEAVGRVAILIGDEGIAALETSRSGVTVPETSVPQTTAPRTASSTATAPPDPGNTKNCSDFAAQAEAQKWYDTYFPFYGDVGKLDTNDNQIACEFLP